MGKLRKHLTFLSYPIQKSTFQVPNNLHRKNPVNF